MAISVNEVTEPAGNTYDNFDYTLGEEIIPSYCLIKQICLTDK